MCANSVDLDETARNASVDLSIFNNGRLQKLGNERFQQNDSWDRVVFIEFMFFYFSPRILHRLGRKVAKKTL